MGTGTTLSGTGTTCHLYYRYWYHFLVPVPLASFAQKMSGFGISHPFFFNIPPQIHPTSKPTMESTKNNSKRGLESIKPLFLNLRLFPQNQNHKDEVRVLFSYLKYLQIFPCRLLGLLEARNEKQSHQNHSFLQTLAFLPHFALILSQNMFSQNEHLRPNLVF